MKRAIALETERTRRDGTRPGYAAPRPAGAPLTAPAPPPKKDQLRGRCPSEDSPGSWAPNPDSSHSNWTIPRGQVTRVAVFALVQVRLPQQEVRPEDVRVKLQRLLEFLNDPVVFLLMEKGHRRGHA